MYYTPVYFILAVGCSFAADNDLLNGPNTDPELNLQPITKYRKRESPEQSDESLIRAIENKLLNDFSKNRSTGPLENTNFNIGDTEDLMCEAFPFCNQNIVAIWKKHVQSQPPTYIYVSADPYFRKEFNSVGEEYRGRTEYFIKGHYARLKIFQLKAEDEGIYSCEIYSLQDQPKCYYSIQFFKLNLKPGEPRYNYEFNITKYGILKENQVEQMPNTSQRNLSWNILFIISTIALLGSFENSLFK